MFNQSTNQLISQSVGRSIKISGRQLSYQSETLIRNLITWREGWKGYTLITCLFCNNWLSTDSQLSSIPNLSFQLDSLPSDIRHIQYSLVPSQVR